MKTYVITLSKRFPTGHNRAGDLTFFHEALANALYDTEAILVIDDEEDISTQIFDRKIHTIRANYPLWAKRIAEVERGEACLSIRQWTGKPYQSKQVEIARLTKEDGVGIQKAELTNDLAECIIGGQHYSYVDIALNDGLHPADWLDWFKGYELTQPMAVIHFTKFRY